MRERVTEARARTAMNVLYFTVVPLASAGNGGSICCRNHVARLAADPHIELTAMVAGRPQDQHATEAFFNGIGVKHHHYQPFRGDNFFHEDNTVASVLSFAIKAVFQFPWEITALHQPHIQEGIDWAIKAYAIQVVVIDYHPSALFLKLPLEGVRTALIKLNREGDFYADLIQAGKTHHGSITRGISLRRARRFERDTDRLVDKVIVIGAPDLPTSRVRSAPVCISPFLDRRSEQWRYSGRGELFFIGDIGHFPNHTAVVWIADRLAPALLHLGCPAKIMIVGAAESQVPAEWRHPNITYLGRSTDQDIHARFLESDLMLCPVDNDYGVKFKSLEALSYGTPLLASTQTLLGLPYLRDIPSIDLAAPERAAREIADLIRDPARLSALSEKQRAQQEAFIATQRTIWSRTLADIA